VRAVDNGDSHGGMNPMLLSMIAVVFAGGATALQAPTNAKMMTAVGSPVNAAFVSFAVGTAALGIIAMILQARPDLTAARALPWYAWIGGLYGAIFVVAAAWGVPRLGVALTITLMVAGQLLIGLILDHFGAFGTPQNPISLGRMAGVALVIAGVVMVRRF
jgi:transporter family-2 protein